MEGKVFYYKCEKCQSEWNGIKQLDCCPFCDTKITAQNSNFTKIEEALSYIFSAHGIDVVKENMRLVALLSDYAPTLERERKLIRLALSLGVYTELMSVSKNDKAIQELAINKAISKLHNDAFMDPIIAKEITGWFVSQLNWESEQLAQERKIEPVVIKNVIKEQNKKTVVYSSNFAHNVGDIIEFGKYPFEANGVVKPIEWEIMDIKDNKALLWSKYCIDACQFAGENLNSSWEYSSLRQWLRAKFMRDAFTTEEINFIVPTSLNASCNPKNNRISGSNTTDKIFIPSNEELNKYKLRNGDLIIKATPYAKMKGVFNDNDYAFWWLRTPGTAEGTQMLVSKTGVVNESGSYVYLKNRGIRPALWINLDKFY